MIQLLITYKKNIRYYLPIVDMNVELKVSSENRNNIQVLPTPESPIKSNLNK